MNRLFRLFATTIGRKLVVAITGVILAGFLIGHMLGNLAVFQGPDAINGYADWLQGHPFVWFARGSLLFFFVVHISTAIRLAMQNQSARPISYNRKQVMAAAVSSRYIVVTGVLVLAFVIFHLLHFTFGVVDPPSYHAVDADGRHDVFRMVVLGFQNPWIAASYIGAMIVLGFHLHHGLASLFQTLGINHDSYNALIRIGSNVVVAVLVFANCSIPILVQAGFVGLSGGK